MKKNKTVKIMAFLALLWIIISVVWTWILILTSWNNEETKIYKTSNSWTITEKELKKLLPNTKINLGTWTSKNNNK